ncbi:hypothetical protein ACLFMI_22150 [Pseudonocardia nantongensis]|uniref:hypothetical protein n=1 Tax=Pseudonocardia nantongensis TaxID=1181885 RepID=UPI00397A38A0
MSRSLSRWLTFDDGMSPGIRALVCMVAAFVSGMWPTLLLPVETPIWLRAMIGAVSVLVLMGLAGVGYRRFRPRGRVHDSG